MKKKYNAFTLVELITALSLLSIIALITIPILIKTVNNSKNKALLEQKRVIINAAKKYALENASELPLFEGDKYSITIDDLKDNALLDESKILDPATNKPMNGCVELTYNSEKEKYKYNYTNTCKDYPSSPILDKKMIPVKYVDNKWVTVGKSKWYDYENKQWANVVVVKNDKYNFYANSLENVEVDENDIDGYFVWIPRFSYTIQNKNNEGTVTYGYNAESNNYPGAIDIKFINKNKYDEGSGFYYGDKDANYRTPDGFWIDNNNNDIRDKDENLSGIWVGKFEATPIIGSSCYNNPNDENCHQSESSIKPNISSLRYQNLNEQMTTAKLFSKNHKMIYNTKVMKNSEWGIVAYLSQSIYGICTSNLSCTEITRNKNESYQTGAGNYKSNINQTTNGNITGIYDMRGGTWERTASIYKNNINNSGLSELPEKKLYDNFTTSTPNDSCNNNICYGGALSETLNWYERYSEFPDDTNNSLIRGGPDSSISILAFDKTNYNNSRYISFRHSISVQ